MADAADPFLVDRGTARCWTAIRQQFCSIVIEKRDAQKLAREAQSLVASAPFERKGVGPVDAALHNLGPLPPMLAADIRQLGLRFAALMNVQEIRIRLEGIMTNACRKIHADYTDLRLITTYAGPGSEYIPANAEPAEANLKALNPGEIALFKGRMFADGHRPCFHRSPQIEGSRLSRLVLVIDTPLDDVRAEHARTTLSQ